jgi:hypothetical protein
MGFHKAATTATTIFLLVLWAADTTVSSFGTDASRKIYSSLSPGVRTPSFTGGQSTNPIQAGKFQKLSRLPFLCEVNRGRGGGSGKGGTVKNGDCTNSPTMTSLAASSVASSTEASTASSPIDADNLALLSDRGREALLRLIEYDSDMGAQRHVYANWPECGVDDEGKKGLAEQVRVKLSEEKEMAT